ncbi:MAG TPA: hypothetical protein VIM29_07295 [Bacillota bacterium]
MGHRGGRSFNPARTAVGLLVLDLTEISGPEWERAREEAQSLRDPVVYSRNMVPGRPGQQD